MIDAAPAVLTDADVEPVDLSLHRYDGTIGPARGIVANLSRDPGQLASAFSRSGLNAWIPVVDVPDARSVEFIVVSGVGVQNRVLDSEQVGDSIRFLLQGDLRRRPMNEDVAALVLTDPDAGAVAMSLERFDGTSYEVVGIATHLSEDVGQLKAAFSRSGFNAWVPSVDVLDPKDVAFVVLADGNRHRALDAEVETGSVRFQLQPVATQSSVGDFDPADFSPADFHTGASP